MPRNIIIAKIRQKRESLKPNSVIAISKRQANSDAHNLQLQHAGRYVYKCNYKVS